jgi:hypothetical protein
MGWDVVGGLRDAAGWASEKIDGAIDGAGSAIDGAVHGAEHAIDDGRKAIVDFGEHHGGVVGKAVAQQVSDGIGVVEGVGLGAYDAGAGITKLAVGAGRLTSPLHWAGHPEQNMARLSATGSALTTMAKLGSPAEWALHTQENLQASQALWNGVTAGYQDAAQSGDAAKFAGRATFDIGSLFIGVGEANAAVKTAEGANALAHVGEGVTVVSRAEALTVIGGGTAEVAPALTHAAESAPALTRAAESTAVVGHDAQATKAVTGETASTATGKAVHKQLADERRATGDYDLVNQPLVDAAGTPIQVPHRVDLKTGEPIPGRTQVAIPDAVKFEKGGIIIDDKPLGRPIAKDRQEMIRFIHAYQDSQGTLPKTIAIQRYDASGVPIKTDLYKPSDFLPGSPR